jgi:hypothetical protein
METAWWSRPPRAWWCRGGLRPLDDEPPAALDHLGPERGAAGPEAARTSVACGGARGRSTAGRIGPAALPVVIVRR